MIINGKEELKRFEKQITNNFKLERALEVYCDFKFDFNIDAIKDILSFWGENQLGLTNYDIYPFGRESSGGYYVLLDNKYVGFISSEGACGIVANNVYMFFNFLAVFKELQSYFHERVFETLETFKKTLDEINDEITEEYNEVFNDFIRTNMFSKNYETLKTSLELALVIQPEFIIEPTDESKALGWEISDDLFCSEHKYIAKLRNGGCEPLEEKNKIVTYNSNNTFNKGTNEFSNLIKKYAEESLMDVKKDVLEIEDEKLEIIKEKVSQNDLSFVDNINDWIYEVFQFQNGGYSGICKSFLEELINIFIETNKIEKLNIQYIKEYLLDNVKLKDLLNKSTANYHTLNDLCNANEYTRQAIYKELIFHLDKRNEELINEKNNKLMKEVKYIINSVEDAIISLNNGDYIRINLFGKMKDVEVFSTGDSKYKNEKNNFQLNKEEIECLNWFIHNVNIEDYKDEIVDYCNGVYDEWSDISITINDIESEIDIYAIAINLTEISNETPDIAFYGSCNCDEDHGICIGFKNKNFIGIESQDWII